MTDTTIKTNIQDLAHTLLDKINLDVTGIQVSESVDDGYVIDLVVSPEESGVLIGYHGETIDAAQLLLSLMLHHDLGEWHRVVVNINDYRQKREQSLKDMASQAAAQAKETGVEVVMPPMESFDRRIIHMYLSEDAAIRTESVGEGRDRRLIIYPASTSS